MKGFLSLLFWWEGCTDPWKRLLQASLDSYCQGGFRVSKCFRRGSADIRCIDKALRGLGIRSVKVLSKSFLGFGDLLLNGIIFGKKAL